MNFTSFHKSKLSLSLLISLISINSYAAGSEQDIIVQDQNTVQNKDSINQNHTEWSTSNNNYYLFKDQDLSGLKILDIGAAEGDNAKAMSDKGADVWALEPDLDSLQIAIEKGHIHSEQAIHGKIDDNHEQGIREYFKKHNIEVSLFWENDFKESKKIPNISNEHDNKFDILTIFMIAFNQGDPKAAKKLLDLLKPDGILIIGFATYGEYKGRLNDNFGALTDYFSVKSTIIVCQDEIINGANFTKKLLEGPECSNAVFVIFEKK